jgi:lambda family phage portal protein
LFNLFKSKQAPAEVPAVSPDSRGKVTKLRRAARAVTRMFKAGEDSRLTMKWGSNPLTADQVVHRWQRVLVARSREQAANSDHAKAFVRMVRQNVVGPNGVMLQAQVKNGRGKLDKDINEGVEAAFSLWGHRSNCDITGQESWRSIQTSCAAAAATDGEFFVRKVYGADAGPWGFALQLLETTRCPVEYDRPQYKPGTSFIRHGIEFNMYGRPLAYHFTTLDEGEADYWFQGRGYIRIPASEIIHGFRKEMTGQRRGLPWMATGLFRLRNLNGYEDASIIAARIAASKMAWIKFDKDSDGPDYDDDNPPEVDVEPGTMGILPRGADIVDWSPQSPSGEFGPFMKHTLRSIAAGLGVPYNELAADLEGVNFSSIRQGTLDSREHWKELQEWLIEQLIQPVFEAWLEYSLLKGVIKAKGKAILATKVDALRDIMWQPRRWDWIDPSADVDAAVTAKNNFLKSPSTIIREQGRDPQTVWLETARDMRAQVDALVAEGFKADEALELVKLGFGMQPKPPVKPANDNKPAETTND